MAVEPNTRRYAEALSKTTVTSEVGTLSKNLEMPVECLRFGQGAERNWQCL
jgi:hypothetical protein